MEKVESPSQFTCGLCAKTCSTERHLKAHIKFIHEKVLPKCEECGITFKRKSNLTKHNKLHENSKVALLNCPNCSFSSCVQKAMLQHYTTHNYNMTPEELEFSSHHEFLQWFDSITKEEKTKFVKSGVSWTLKGGSKCVVYKCYRDGFYSSKGQNKRRLKAQGSNKINGFCPASVRTITTDEGIVKVSFLRTHVGHDVDVKRLTLTKAEREFIAEKLIKNVPIKSILESLKNNATSEKFQKLQLLTRKDIINVAYCYNLDSNSLLKNDCASVDNWLNAPFSKHFVCFHKPIGKTCIEFPQAKEDDFYLVVMNTVQKWMLEEFGNDCVCIDRIYGYQKNDLKIFTLMILDEMRQGFPCAFFVSNVADALAMEIFLTTIKNKMFKKITPKSLLSDVDDPMYNVWRSVIGPVSYHLYCSWLVDAAWRNKLTKIKGGKNQTEVYHKIKNLMFDVDMNSFEGMMSTLMNDLYSKAFTREFATFFEKFRVDSTPWAYCHRLQAAHNANSAFENIHNSLKHIFLDGKKVQRFDRTLITFMKFVRDKFLELSISKKWGKFNNNLSELRKGHSLGLEMSATVSEVEGDNKWIITSSDETCTISFLNHCTCQLKCEECTCCLHMYECSCVDSSLNWELCKHIHFLCLEAKKSQEAAVTMDFVDIDIDDAAQYISQETSTIKQLLPIGTKTTVIPISCNPNISFRKQEFCSELIHLINQIHTEEALDAAEKVLEPLKNIIRSQIFTS